ncbi:MAG: hypothetical protein ACM3SR_00720 [Ignavibacteriales bacterium]
MELKQKSHKGKPFVDPKLIKGQKLDEVTFLAAYSANTAIAPKNDPKSHFILPMFPIR